MSIKSYGFLVLTGVLFFSGAEVYSQKSKLDSFNKQLELRHDNDFFLRTDRYYSSGLYATFRTTLHKGIFKENSEQLDITIGQEVYTPSLTGSTNTVNFDRPYAGFAGLTTTWSISAKKNQLFKTEVLIGIAGVNSGAGGLQRWYHRLINAQSPLYTGEVANSFHLNAYFSYVKEWDIVKKPFGFTLAIIPNLAFGSRDIFIEPETVLYFGRRNNVAKSIAYNRIGSTDREIYFALRASYRNVLYNGLIEGNLFGDNSPVVRESTNSVWRFGLDFYNRYKRNDYKFGIRFNTSETQQSQNHKYVMLSYGLLF